MSRKPLKVDIRSKMMALYPCVNFVAKSSENVEYFKEYLNVVMDIRDAAEVGGVVALRAGRYLSQNTVQAFRDHHLSLDSMTQLLYKAHEEALFAVIDAYVKPKLDKILDHEVKSDPIEYRKHLVNESINLLLGLNVQLGAKRAGNLIEEAITQSPSLRID